MPISNSSSRTAGGFLDVMNEQDAFQKWWNELKSQADCMNWPITNDPLWREYFDEGYDPIEALIQDMSYGG